MDNISDIDIDLTTIAMENLNLNNAEFSFNNQVVTKSKMKPTTTTKTTIGGVSDTGNSQAAAAADLDLDLDDNNSLTATMEVNSGFYQLFPVQSQDGGGGGDGLLANQPLLDIRVFTPSNSKKVNEIGQLKNNNNDKTELLPTRNDFLGPPPSPTGTYLQWFDEFVTEFSQRHGISVKAAMVNICYATELYALKNGLLVEPQQQGLGQVASRETENAASAVAAAPARAANEKKESQVSELDTKSMKNEMLEKLNGFDTGKEKNGWPSPATTEKDDGVMAAPPEMDSRSHWGPSPWPQSPQSPPSNDYTQYFERQQQQLAVVAAAASFPFGIGNPYTNYGGQDGGGSQPTFSGGAARLQYPYCKGCCPFCRKNGEEESVYKSHNLYQPGTRKVICPVLRRFRCEICGATGDWAHTKAYCRLNPNGVIGGGGGGSGAGGNQMFMMTRNQPPHQQFYCQTGQQ